MTDTRGARLAVVAEARTWLGTKFADNQRCKGAGCDCLGLIVGVYQYAGVLPGQVTIPAYSAQHHFHQRREIYIEGLLQHCGEVIKPGLGDVALFHFGHTYSHAGIVLEWPKQMIHAYCGMEGVSLVDPTRHAQLRTRWQAALFFSPWEPAGRIQTDALRYRVAASHPACSQAIDSESSDRLNI